ncbi:MAG: PEGA domain-containing protein [Myxococcota bacterium]
MDLRGRARGRARSAAHHRPRAGGRAAVPARAARLPGRDLESALEHLLASNRLVPNANVVFNLGRVHEARGDLASAWRCYDAYVGVETDPARREEAEEALAAIEPKVARVRVQSSPPGARVYLEREALGSRGVTPLTLAVTPGRHTLLVAADGARVNSRSVDLSAGTLAEVDVALEDALPTSTVWGGASVRSGEVELVAVDDVRCTLLGQISAVALHDDPYDGPPLGSALAAAGPAAGLYVELRLGAADATPVRAVLTPVSRKAVVLRDSAALRPVFERCAPEAPALLSVALERLDKGVRLDAVRVFAEWAAWRGAGDVGPAASACARGDCVALAQALAD